MLISLPFDFFRSGGGATVGGKVGVLISGTATERSCRSTPLATKCAGDVVVDESEAGTPEMSPVVVACENIYVLFKLVARGRSLDFRS